MPTDSRAQAEILARQVGRSAWERSAAVVGRAGATVMSWPVWIMFAVVLAAEWVTLGVVAAINPHNGWLYYNGGDDTWYYTSAWVLGNGHIPQSYVGYGYSFLLAPLARIAGPNLLNGLPLVVIFNAVVLWPIGLLCLYGLAKAIGGRGFAYFASLLWAVLPLLAIPYFYERYHHRYITTTLPGVLGLTALTDFPSLVSLLVAAYFVVRAIGRPNIRDALVAGAAAGFAIGIKPSNAVFLFAPFAGLLLARRPREVLGFALGLTPALAALALWKYRGIGHIPAFSSSSSALATGASTPPVGGLAVHKYLPLNWSHLWFNIQGIREYTWSVRLLEWVIVAGAIGLLRRSAAIAVFVGGWLAAYVLLKGSAPQADIKGGTFFRLVAPAFPAFFLLGCSVVFLVPLFGRRLAARGGTPAWPSTRRSWIAVLAVTGLVSLVPPLAFATISPLKAPHATTVPDVDQYVPANAFPVSATKTADGSVRLSWPSQAARGTLVTYAIFRASNDELSCPPKAHSASSCSFFADQTLGTITPVGRTLATTWQSKPPPGWWFYRVAVKASPYGPPNPGDFLLISRLALVHVTR